LTCLRDEYFAPAEENDQTGLVRRFEALIRSVPDYLAAQQSDLAKARFASLGASNRSRAICKAGQLDAARHILQPMP